MRFFLKTIVLSSFLSLIIISCGGKSQNEAEVKKYCNCVNSILNDSLISMSPIDSMKRICFDSLIVKNEFLKDETEYLASFDSIQQVKDLNSTLLSNVTENVSKILLNKAFRSSSDFTVSRNPYVMFDETYSICLFDKKMFTFTDYEVISSTPSQSSQTGTYKIEISEEVYITLIDANQKNYLYKLLKSDKDGYYLKGNITLWQE